MQLQAHLGSLLRPQDHHVNPRSVTLLSRSRAVHFPKLSTVQHRLASRRTFDLPQACPTTFDVTGVPDPTAWQKWLEHELSDKLIGLVVSTPRVKIVTTGVRSLSLNKSIIRAESLDMVLECEATHVKCPGQVAKGVARVVMKTEGHKDVVEVCEVTFDLSPCFGASPGCAGTAAAAGASSAGTATAAAAAELPSCAADIEFCARQRLDSAVMCAVNSLMWDVETKSMESLSGDEADAELAALRAAGGSSGDEKMRDGQLVWRAHKGAWRAIGVN